MPMTQFDGASDAWHLLDESRRSACPTTDAISSILDEEALCIFTAFGEAPDSPLACSHDRLSPDSTTSAPPTRPASPMWVLTPLDETSDERPLKKARSVPDESSPQAYGGAQACSYAASLFNPSAQRQHAPHDYGLGTFARHGASAADAAELRSFSLFPLELEAALESLQPQT